MGVLVGEIGEAENRHFAGGGVGGAARGHMKKKSYDRYNREARPEEATSQ